MRTTLNLPENLIAEAIKLTGKKTKTGVIRLALTNLIEEDKLKDLKNYYGEIDLDIDLVSLRK